MRVFLVIVGALIGAMLLISYFLSTPPARLAVVLRRGAGVVCLIAAAGMLFFRQFAFAAPLAFAGWMILMKTRSVQTTGGSGRSSTVRSAGLEMTLDHDTGELDGRVLAGRFDGHLLSDLKLPELLQVAEDFRGDPESLRLLETYLDRAHAGWRDHVKADHSRRSGPPPRPGSMDENEAYDILGLKPGADEAEVREAHRRLIKQVHPDRGGSAALAAKINEAKDRLLRRHS